MAALNEMRIGFIGGGRMAEAIFGGLINASAVPAGNVTVTDIDAARLDDVARRCGVATVPNNDAGNGGAIQVAKQSDLLMLAVKPQFAPPVLAAIGPKTKKDALVVSIIGGATLELLAGYFDGPVIRVMPNTPMMVGKGIAGIAPGPLCEARHTALALELFGHLGKAYVIQESLIDPLTGISGCGPAYCYLFIEALADGGVAAGLPRDMALSLAAQTLVGAGQMALDSGYHPAQLKDQVCSPGGGTIAGVQALEEDGLRGAVMDAVAAGIERMRQISEQLK